MTQINEYAEEALTLGLTDLMDIDKDMGGGVYESQKVQWGTVLTAAQNSSINLGTSDLGQSDPDRYYNAHNGRLEWQNLRKFFIEILDWNSEAIHGFRVQRDFNLTLPDKDRLMTEFMSNLGSYLRIFEEGRVDIREGGLGVSDGSIPLTAIPTNSSNAGLLALFQSLTKPTVFTDQFYPEAPVEANDSMLSWFRSISKGVRFPNMTQLQRDGILTPELGLVIYNISSNRLQVYNGIGLSGWQSMN
jgi:hypothetical protein